MSHEATTTYNREMIGQAAWLYWRRKLLGGFLIVLACFSMGLALVVAGGSRTWLDGTLLALSSLAIVIFVSAYFVYRHRSLRLFEQLRTPEAKWRFTDTRITVESAIGKSEHDWRVLAGIIKSPRLWLLVYRHGSYSIFPVAGVPGEVLDFLSNRVIEHGGKVS